ncbi:MAG TPA: flagellar biosynthesis repressor FlbT [Arenibaculum sp.]|nr:flagellar biosynthesis repressor FlbT [Arenibaculum sp.]
MSLKIRLAPDERIVINGALIQADGRCSLVFLNNSSFLTEKHIMRPAEASTPARRIYYMIQNSYMANDAERPPILATLHDLIGDFHQATTVQSIKDTLDEIRELVANAEYYPALRLSEVVMRHEDRHLGNPKWTESRRQGGQRSGPEPEKQR